jgi:hypothetical protein
MEKQKDIHSLLEAANDKTIVKGYTHDFITIQPGFLQTLLKK